MDLDVIIWSTKSESWTVAVVHSDRSCVLLALVWLYGNIYFWSIEVQLFKTCLLWHFGLQKFPSAALNEEKHQNPHFPDWAGRNVDGAIEHMRLCETVYVAHWGHFSQMICLSLLSLSPLATSFFVSLSKCLLWLGGFQHYFFHPSPPTYKTSFYHGTKAAMYFFVSCLFPGLACVLAVCRPLHFSIPPTSLHSSYRLQ